MATRPTAQRQKTPTTNGADGRGRTRAAKPQNASTVVKDGNGRAAGVVAEADLRELLGALRAARDGATGIRLNGRKSGIIGELAQAFNQLAETREQATREIERVTKVVGREGRLTERAETSSFSGTWERGLRSLNGLIDDLVRPTTEVARVIDAVADGDLSQKMALTIDAQPVRGEFRRIGTTVNSMVD